MPEDNSLDVLGIKGLSDSIRISVEHLWKGAAAFLARVCLPAADEFGQALKDRVSAWRATNAAKILNAANELQLASGIGMGEALHPRLAHIAIDDGSWSDDDEVQKMWAGLLVSGTSPNGTSDENLVFMNLLRQLSPLQGRIVKYSVENANKYSTEHGLALSDELTVATDSLTELFGQASIHRLDRELDHLRHIGLIGGVWGGGGIHPGGGETILTPTALALNLFVRAQGSKVAPCDFWHLARRPSSDEIDGPK